MKQDLDKKSALREGFCFARAAVPMAAVMLLAGCADVPNWADPMEWYGGAPVPQTSESVNREKLTTRGGGKLTTRGGGKQLPKLGRATGRPRAPSDRGRGGLADSLTADRSNAEYSNVPIRGQGASKVRPMARVSTPSEAPVAKAKPSTSPVARPSQFEPRPPSPAASTANGNAIPPLAARLNPNVRSVARIGNPSFGAPPGDIAAAQNVGQPRQTGERFAAQSPRAAIAFPNSNAHRAPGPLAMVRFKAGSAALTQRARQQVRRIAGMYRQRGGAIRIEGHSSSRTRNMDPVLHHLVNFNVSLDRANTVARELVRQGVPSEALFVAAMSDSKPLYYEVMPAGDAGNQRVEFHFVN